MALTIRSKVVKIGNSRGIRIPRSLLEQAGLTEEVELSVQGDKLIVQSAHLPRQGWDARFLEMAEAGDDQMLDEITLSSWDEEEWEW
jgi:antitoxin MazE